jgi:hypothetical protein
MPLLHSYYYLPKKQTIKKIPLLHYIDVNVCLRLIVLCLSFHSSSQHLGHLRTTLCNYIAINLITLVFFKVFFKLNYLKRIFKIQS